MTKRRRIRLSGTVATTLCLSMICAIATHTDVVAQKPRKRESYIPGRVKEVLPKGDRLTLRYKPQAGTLLYNVQTNVTQRVRSGTDDLTGMISNAGQLAYHNIAIDYASNVWSFEQYFTKFKINGRTITGDTLSLREPFAVNRITRLTYKMTGEEVEHRVIDSIKLLNTESQTNFYFFQPPRLLVPLPKNLVTYGDTWSEHRVDTVNLRDTINIGVTVGMYTYDVHRVYRLDRLLDTVGNHIALIVATDSGHFQGYQTNSVTGLEQKARGPLTGVDTTWLDLFTGRVIIRATHLMIPVVVEVSDLPPFSDVLEVRSTVELDESNIRRLRSKE